MELETGINHMVERPKTSAVRWYKEWVPQDVVSTGGKCFLLKWVTEDTLKALKAKSKEPETEEPESEPEPTTEVLFLCSFEGCGKTFIDAGALKKHSHIHGERQYVCHYEGCRRKFLDSSKLKRHFLTHTGERHFVCPHEGCGKAFSLDFNLRAHMRTHSQENYHTCPYVDCGKRYAHEYKLKAHVKAHHEKNMVMDKPPSAAKPSAINHGSASSARPYACPYEGCDKCYIHEYKLNLHLKKEHPRHNAEVNGRNDPDNDHQMDASSDQDAHGGKGRNRKNLKRKKPDRPVSKMPPSKVQRQKIQNVATPNLNIVKKQCNDMYEEEDSEETEEDHDDVEDGWRYTENNEDDEETEYED